ncbi:MAG TPA: VOC family protein [Thermoleophilaceae bacterium]
MTRAFPNPVVHMELLTSDLPRACEFYTRLFQWRAATVEVAGGEYHALEPGEGIGAGVVEGCTKRSIWLPYIEVADVVEATSRARELGACVPVDSREGPTGWRSVVATPEGAPVALWQSKR